MSFGSENPELWDEISKKGIESKLRGQLEREGFDDIDDYTVEAVVAALYEVAKIRDPLLDWSNDEICNSEADYWGGKIDEAVMRHEAKKGY